MPSPGSPDLGRVQSRALIVGAVAGVLCVVGAVLDLRQFYYSYLIAFLFWLGITLGSMALLMIQHLSGGAWGFVIRRQLEAAARLIPMMAVLFIPIALGVHVLYPWANADIVAGDPIIQAKAQYLNVPFFFARAAIYFVGWSLFGLALSRRSLEQDQNGEQPAKNRMKALSAGGMPFFVLMMTFAGVDWIMSLEPHWYSTIFGMIIVSGQGLSAIAVASIVMTALSKEAPVSEVAIPARFHDLGNMMLVLLMVWAYTSFSQFLIIWSGNLPEEIPWYLHRVGQGWQVIALAIVVFHFAMPFALLLSRQTKRLKGRLATLSVALLVMRLVEMFWMVAPERSPGAFHLYWADLVAPAAIGGLWVWAYLRELQSRPVLPRYGDEGAYESARQAAHTHHHGAAA